MSAATTRKAPRYDLAEIVKYLGTLREEIGFSPASRETVAHALGHRSLSGTAMIKLGALNHYGLIERHKGGSYGISDLGKTILMPTSPKEYQVALAEAVKEPMFFKELFDRFGGHPVPGMLANILAREFGVHANTSEQVADVFKSSTEFAGLLRNGVLHTEPEESADAPSTDEKASVEKGPAAPADRTNRVEVAPAQVVPQRKAGYQRYTLPLDVSGRVATIEVPIPVSASDLEQVARWVTFMKGVVSTHSAADSVSGEFDR